MIMNDTSKLRIITNIEYYSLISKFYIIIKPFNNEEILLAYDNETVRDKDLERLDERLLAKRILHDGTMEYV